MTPRLRLFPLLIFALVACTISARAQDRGSLNPQPLPPLANPDDPKIGAKQLFARKVLPAALPTRSIGGYTKGCLAGAAQMPLNGETWQVMRLSRNRYWGHPNMIALLKRLAANAHKDAGWPGILVGDIGQPRGGPALSGHASHQIGLDADVWLTPMPDRKLSREDREEMSAVMMVRDDRLDIDPRVFTPGHVLVIRDAARGAGGAAHLRQSRDQEGAVPRGQGRSRLAVEDPAVVGPRLPLPHSHAMSARQPRLRGTEAASGGRRLQAVRSRLLVQGFGAAPEASAEAAETPPADDAGADAG
ncbi:hypothetical protein ACVWY5_008532 [Bradyrhizobium sp. USDA 3256]